MTSQLSFLFYLFSLLHLDDGDASDIDLVFSDGKEGKEREKERAKDASIDYFSQIFSAGSRPRTCGYATPRCLSSFPHLLPYRHQLYTRSQAVWRLWSTSLGLCSCISNYLCALLGLKHKVRTEVVLWWRHAFAFARTETQLRYTTLARTGHA